MELSLLFSTIPPSVGDIRIEMVIHQKSRLTTRSSTLGIIAGSNIAAEYFNYQWQPKSRVRHEQETTHIRQSSFGDPAAALE
jgi:hypothetical protein